LNPPYVSIPISSLGWTGGDTYLSNMKRALTELAGEGLIKLLPPHVEWIESQFPLRPRLKRNFDFDIRSDFSNVVFLPWAPVRRLPKPLIWVPDLQDIDLPEMFQKNETRARHRVRRRAIAKGARFYFSSKTMEQRFREIYPKATVAGLVRFAFNETNRPSSIFEVSTSERLTEFGGAFFYAPNQFWKHKNHIVLLEAFVKYREQGGRRSLVLSGDQNDPRWPQYSKDLNQFISKTNGIHSLGFIPRGLQLSLYSKCSVVIQPSLYEGWSSSIEEAIRFGKRIIASDIPVIREQLGNLDGTRLFVPNDVEDLTTAMLDSSNSDYTRSEHFAADRWERFKSDLHDLIVEFSD
jgi:glycosyltransferase involved in cell wall biosynthesis